MCVCAWSTSSPGGAKAGRGAHSHKRKLSQIQIRLASLRAAPAFAALKPSAQPKIQVGRSAHRLVMSDGRRSGDTVPAWGRTCIYDHKRIKCARSKLCWYASNPQAFGLSFSGRRKNITSYLVPRISTIMQRARARTMYIFKCVRDPSIQVWQFV